MFASSSLLCRVGVLALGLLGVAFLPQGPEIVASESTAHQADLADDLIHQLGATSYAQREQAENTLLRMGIEALPLLHDAASDVDLEVRYRARRLIRLIQQDHQLRLLDRFEDDYDPELAQQIAGWSRYAELVGDDREARRLFVQMYEAEPELMRRMDRSSSSLPFVLEQRAIDLRPQTGQRPSSLSVPAPSTAALLLASLDPAANASPNVLTLINSLVSESAFRREATASQDPPVRRLLAAWVSGAADVAAATRMTIGTKFELGASVDPALELIQSGVHGSQMQYAVFTVARFGNTEHIPVLERLLDDETILSERQRGSEEDFTCQVRDVALAALIHLVGKHPQEFGFDELRPNSNSLFALHTAGFDSPEKREAALRQWELWCQSQHRQGRSVDENAVEGVGL